MNKKCIGSWHRVKRNEDTNNIKFKGRERLKGKVIKDLKKLRLDENEVKDRIKWLLDIPRLNRTECRSVNDHVLNKYKVEFN